ncbi:TetR/AcrR family transcriptional regulator [Achromobacter sp. AONIH1]|uniref:TetR/AcrR family transcriptional regulator n=1 Tax=unclassified Achromobacter TaxID=2626865 RepID=UPI000CD1C871|nr:TetR/AcrR family transcriptional regulator [Achromobacter sp. AONIH1]AUT44750.1 TetR family transcriptional regulator [Achromobacter sp. AONIH1]
MPPDTPPAARGRPRTITRERIADAGIAVGLPNVSFVNVAAALGVSHMALYKRVDSLEALKLMVAEEIFTRWPVPHAGADTHPELRDYLVALVISLRDMVKTHPGLAPYLLRPSVTTQPMMAKIHGHQSEVARVYGVSPDQARVLLATVAFHCIAVADTVYSVAGEEPAARPDRATEEAQVEAEFAQGMYALIVGALAVLEQREPFDPALFQARQ